MIPRFKKSRFEPKPIETDYWIDLNENEYGGVFKYYDNNAMVWKQTESITREKEPQFTSSAAYKITTNDIDYWNAKVGIEDFDALKEEILDLGSQFEGVTVETLEYYNDILRSDFNNDLQNKADKSSTLSGYGIRDAYTKSQVDTKFNEWKVELPENISYFKNDVGYVTESNLESKLPDNIVSDANYVHTDNNFSGQYKQKLDTLDSELNQLKNSDNTIKTSVSENTTKINNLQKSVDENIAVAVESMSKEIAKKANADDVYTKQYLDEVFKQFVRKTHKTFGFVNDRPTKDLDTQDTGFIFYDYTVNEPLLWVADEWRLLRTNEAFEGYLLEKDIIRQVTDWDWSYIDDTEYVSLDKYTGEYSSTMDFVIPNTYIDGFVLNVGDSMDKWAGKSLGTTSHIQYGYSQYKDKDGNPIKYYRNVLTESPLIAQVRRFENLNPGYTIPGIDENPDDDIPAEDVLINYITNLFGTPVLLPKDPSTSASGQAVSLFSQTTEKTPINSFNVAQGIRTIGTGTFMNITAASGNELTIPAGVEYIDDMAFAGSSITEVKFPRNPIYFGAYAFSKCPLKKVHFPKTLDWDKIKEGYGCFAFASCPGTVELILDEGVKAIPYSCFDSTKVTLKSFPDSLEYIGGYAFYNSLTNFKFDSNKIKYMAPMAFQGCTFSSITFRDDVKVLPPALFGSSTYTTLTSIILPPNLEKAYVRSFPPRMMSMATSFVTSPKLKELPPYAFEYYANNVNNPSYVNGEKVFPLPNTKLVLSEGLESIAHYSIFGSCFSQDLVLPESLKYIQSYAISKPYGFTNKSLYIPKNVKVIGGCCQPIGSICSPEDWENGMFDVYAPVSKSGYSMWQFWEYLEDGGEYDEYGYATFYQFGANSMKEFTVDPENKWFKAIDGVLFSKDGKRLIGYPCAHGKSTYEVPEGCVYMDLRVFAASGFKNTFTITKPDGTEQTIPKITTADKGSDFYIGEDQLREVVISNTMINYSADELKQMFPRCHYKGETNMLFSSQDYFCGIEKFTAKPDHPLYKNDGDWLLSKDGTKLQIIPMGMKGTKRIPDSVTEIVPGAYQYSLTDMHRSDLVNTKLEDLDPHKYPSTMFYGLYLIIPPSVVTISDVVLFELNLMNRSQYNAVILEEGNPVFVQDPSTGLISRR